MTEFKVGDRVRYTGTYSPGLKHAIGVVRRVSSTNNVDVDWGMMGSRGVFPENIEMVEPPSRKDTPRVGDTVRVVLEWEVTGRDLPSGRFAVGTAAYPENTKRNWIYPDAEHVKSVEIITPAKPSVADLPVSSALRDAEGVVFIKVGANMPKPWADQWGGRYTDADIDLFDWTLLVEKGSE